MPDAFYEVARSYHPALKYPFSPFGLNYKDRITALSPVENTPSPVLPLHPPRAVVLRNGSRCSRADVTLQCAGSITLVLIHGDKRVGRYRNQLTDLEEYSKENRLPLVRRAQ